MTDRNIKVGVEVDASSADQGLDKLANKAQSTSKIIKKAGEDAGQGFSKVGEGSEQASEKIDRTSKSIIQSIQRTTVALESGGRTTAKYYETIANQRGVSVDALRPYLEQLKAVEAAQGKFTQASGSAVTSLNKVGISAAQTAAAMRNVPAQFTDIVTSLQGGQAPLTVLLQQGGQLKDMFGGIGNAAGALGKYMLGLISPFTLLAGAAVVVGVAYNQGSKEAQEFNKSLVLTGNAAGTTTNQLMDMAKAISSSGASTQGAAAEALAALAGTGKVGVDNLQRFASVAVQTQKIVGTSVQDTAKAFADLAKSPLEASLKLDEQYNFLTVSIYKQIKALQDQGDVIEAAKVAQNAYADALAQRTVGIEQNLGSIERGWMAIKDGAKSAWDTMLGIGRDTTESERIEQLQRNIANRADFISRERPQSLLIPKAQAANAKDQAELDLLLKKTEQKKIQGELDKKAIELKNAGIEFDRQGEKYLTSALKLEKDIAQARKLGAAAGLDEKQINDRVAAIRKDYAEKNKKTQQEETLASQVAFVERKKLRDAEKEMEKQFSDDIKQFSQEQVKRTKNLTDSLINQITRQDRAYFGIIEQQDAYRQSLQDNADLMQLEASLMGQSATDRNTAIEQYKIEIALQKELLKIKQDINLTDAQKTQLSESATENANIAKSQVALKAQQGEWSKFYGEIYNGLSDSLYRGFEAGKGFFQSFWDGIKNLFKTTVLKLAVQGVMTSVIGGSLSLAGGMANAATGGSAIGTASGLYQMGSSAYNLFTGGAGAAFNNFAMGSVGQSLGLSTIGGTAAEEAAMLTGGSGGAAGASLTTLGSIGSTLATVAPYLAVAATLFNGLSMGEKQINGSNVSGTLGTDNINRNVNWSQSGGFLRGDRSGTWSYNLANSTAMADGVAYQDSASLKSDQALLKVLSDSYSALKTSSADYAKALGLDATSIASRTDAISFEIGKTADETNANLAKALSGVADVIASDLISPLSDFAKQGETASQTLARLATGLSDVNLVMKSVGFTEFAKSLEGSNAAARLAELTGGIEKLATGAQYFFENFLSDAEKIKPSADLVTDTMKRLGQSSVDTIDEFKNLVQGLDLSTESGAKMYAELIAIAPQFKAVADYTSGLTGALTEFESAAKATADAAKLEADILSQRVSLQNEYNQLTMTSTELLALQRNEIYESNRALFDSISAVKQKREAEISAAEANKALTQTMIKNAELAQQILINAVDAERKVSQSVLESTLAILDSRKSASATVFETQKAILGASLSAAKSLASTLYSEANRIDGIAKSMVLADNPNNIGGSVFAAQAKLRSGDTSAETIKLATSSTQDMFASWADYAQNFFETKSLLQSSAAKAYSVAGEAMSQADAISAQLVAAEESYKSDLAHYAEQEKIARETMSQQTAYFDKIVSIATLALQEAQGTKIAVLSLPAAIMNANANIQALASRTERPAQLIPSEPPANDLLLTEIRDLLVEQGRSSERLTNIMNDATNGGSIIMTVSAQNG